MQPVSIPVARLMDQTSERAQAHISIRAFTTGFRNRSFGRHDASPLVVMPGRRISSRTVSHDSLSSASRNFSFSFACIVMFCSGYGNVPAVASRWNAWRAATRSLYIC